MLDAIFLSGLVDDHTLPKPPDFPATALPYPVGYWHSVRSRII